MGLPVVVRPLLSGGFVACSGDPLLDESHQPMGECCNSVEAADSWAAVDSLRDELDAVYGEQPDGTAEIREERYQ